jgi:tetratricopeptide (TPR) repeat protein
MTQEMLTPVLDEVGLGFFLDKDNPGQFGHTGGNEGFQGLLTMNFESGKGIAIMANSENGIAVGTLLLRRVAKEYGWNYKSPEDVVFETLVLTEKLNGVQAALQQYAEFKKSGSAEHKVEEGTLNRFGQLLLYSHETQDAIAVFQRNVQEYPDSANVYESLGEAYMQAGAKDLAIQNFEKSLQLNSKNQTAIDILKKLKAGR